MLILSTYIPPKMFFDAGVDTEIFVEVLFDEKPPSGEVVADIIKNVDEKTFERNNKKLIKDKIFVLVSRNNLCPNTIIPIVNKICIVLPQPNRFG